MKKTYLFILFSFISIMVYGQAAKVHLYKAATPLQKKIAELSDQRMKLESKISNVENNIDMSAFVDYGGGYSDLSLKELKSILSAKKTLLSKYKASGLVSLYNRSIELTKEIAQLSGEHLDKFFTINTAENKIKGMESEINGVEKRINELEGNKVKEDEHNQEMAKMDNRLKSINNEVANQDQQLKQYNNKSESLNDFLASVSNNTKKTNGDFLDKSGSKGSSDFLASSANGNDPLSSSSGNKKNWKISYRSGRIQGVIDNEGNDLIPFKKWRILEYKDGIAKVKIILNTYSQGDNCIGYYTAQIFKEGFVDKNGSFLDGDKVSYNIDWQALGCLRLVSSDESYDQQQKDEEYQNHMDRIKKSKFERETKAWVLNNINRYK